MRPVYYLRKLCPRDHEQPIQFENTERARRVGDALCAASRLWALCALYFASSVFYVKLRVTTINPRKEEARRRCWKRCALYHVFLFLSLVLLAITRNPNLFALAAFAPVLIRSFWYLANPVRKSNLQRVGWLEMIYSIVFLIFITLTFRV